MATPKALYLAESFGGFSTPEITLERIMHYSGHNVGNFAFWNAARLVVDADYRCFPFGTKSWKEDVDLIVIPAANFLNKTADLGWLADLIVNVDKPVVVVGLGAQSEHEDEVPVLKDGTVRFLQEASRRTPFLGMRGAFSAKVCSAYGIENTRVMGCPSLFTSGDRNLAQKVALKWDADVSKVAVHAASIKAHVRIAERFLFNLLQSVPGSSYVLQRPVELMKLVTGEAQTGSDDAYLGRLRTFLAPDLPKERFNQILRQSGLIPYSVDSWRFSLQSHSHSLGTRIHGAMMSLAAFIPTICITHDTRTRELCEVMCVPSYPASKMGQQSSVKEIFQEVRIDADKFEQNRSDKARSYVDLLAGLSLEPSDFLSKNFL